MSHGDKCLNPKCEEVIPTTLRRDALYCSNACGNRARNRKHYKLNPEVYKKQREHYNSDAQSRILWRAKNRSKKNNIPFNLDYEDIVVPTHCPVLGVLLERGTRGACDNAPSLDRIVPELGYIKGNIRIISNRANLLKSNATLEEMEMVVKDLRKLKEKDHAVFC